MRKQAFVLFLVLVVSVSLLSSCVGKDEQEPISYGTVEMVVQLGVLPTNDVPADPIDPLVFTSGMLMTQGKERITIRDFAEIENETVITSDMPMEVHNGVITTKWFYYLSLEKDLRVNASFYQRVREDEYCMEKLNVDWFSYVVEEETPYFGKTWREVCRTSNSVSEITNEPDVWGTDEEGKPVVWDLSLQTKNPDVWNICTNYYGCLRTSALQRYGVLSYDGFSGIGKLTVTGSDSKEITLDVVGYIETEADKLLSTGVSMDKNSDEYKIVMQQLQNPVFYSVCGNILEE